MRKLKSFIVLSLLITLTFMSCYTESLDSSYNNKLQEKESNIEMLTFEKQEFSLDYLNSIRKIPILSPKPFGNKISKKYASLSIDTDLFLELLQKDVLTSDENYNLKLILKSLGFQTLDDFLIYCNQMDKLAEKIVNETNFLDLDENSRNNVLFNYFNQNDKWSYGTNKVDNCENSLVACNNAVTANYNAGIVACTIAAIGIGAATGGIGGVIAQVFCLAANFDVATAAYGVCDASYSDCIGN